MRNDISGVKFADLIRVRSYYIHLANTISKRVYANYCPSNTCTARFKPHKDSFIPLYYEGTLARLVGNLKSLAVISLLKFCDSILKNLTFNDSRTSTTHLLLRLPYFSGSPTSKSYLNSKTLRLKIIHSKTIITDTLSTSILSSKILPSKTLITWTEAQAKNAM